MTIYAFPFKVGTYRLKTIEELRPVVYEAIRSGYRLIGMLQLRHIQKEKRVLKLGSIDSATVYRNEEVLGQILKEVFADPSFGVKREDLFITSKLCESFIYTKSIKNKIG